jgi:hypothetical protein
MMLGMEYNIFWRLWIFNESNFGSCFVLLVPLPADQLKTFILTGMFSVTAPSCRRKTIQGKNPEHLAVSHAPSVKNGSRQDRFYGHARVWPALAAGPSGDLPLRSSLLPRCPYWRRLPFVSGISAWMVGAGMPCPQALNASIPRSPGVGIPEVIS